VGLSEQEILAQVDRHASAAPLTALAGPCSGFEPADVPGCTFRSNTPSDFDGPAQREQLLTKGYARE
jgi:hypothetical protein